MLFNLSRPRLYEVMNETLNFIERVEIPPRFGRCGSRDVLRVLPVVLRCSTVWLGLWLGRTNQLALGHQHFQSAVTCGQYGTVELLTSVEKGPHLQHTNISPRLGSDL